MNRNELKEKLAMAFEDAIDEAESLPKGSEERARAYKNIKIAWDALQDEYKFSEELEDQRVKLEKELELKEAEIRNEDKRRGDKLRDLLITVTAIVGTSVFGAVMEVKGWRLPRQLNHFTQLWKLPKN